MWFGGFATLIFMWFGHSSTRSLHLVSLKTIDNKNSDQSGDLRILLVCLGTLKPETLRSAHYSLRQIMQRWRHICDYYYCLALRWRNDGCYQSAADFYIDSDNSDWMDASKFDELVGCLFSTRAVNIHLLAWHKVAAWLMHILASPWVDSQLYGLSVMYKAVRREHCFLPSSLLCDTEYAVVKI